MAISHPEAQIADALIWHLSQLVLTPARPISYPGMTFSPTVGVPYLAATHLPNTTGATGLAFDSDREFRGLFQVSVFWPARKGIIEPFDLAGTLAVHFASGTRILRHGRVVEVNRPPTVAPAIEQPDWVQVPVTIRWRCVAP
ncbi:DUF4128 domain-containing protein [Xanthobacter versatilis]|uniref:DUF4128 domain-containing protein n=1 Tax=Xanthobacter autotrophicus (strain ATCC BAA-1158 / Py2) TaxID=78245 RepID=UPI00372754A6